MVLTKPFSEVIPPYLHTTLRRVGADRNRDDILLTEKPSDEELFFDYKAGGVYRWEWVLNFREQRSGFIFRPSCTPNTGAQMVIINDLQGGAAQQGQPYGDDLDNNNYEWRGTQVINQSVVFAKHGILTPTLDGRLSFQWCNYITPVQAGGSEDITLKKGSYLMVTDFTPVE